MTSAQPTLTLYTDGEVPNWLRYIVDQFTAIQQPHFNIQIQPKTLDEVTHPTIFYGSGDGFAIPNKSDVALNTQVKYISDTIFVLKGTEGEGAISYDLFWNAFVFLSRKEEYDTEQNGKRIYSYQQNHPREDKSTFRIPIVNHLFDELAGKITLTFPELTFEKGAQIKVDLSHDLDYITKTFQLRSKQTVFNTFNMLKNILRPKLFFQYLGKTFSFFFRNPSYWCFDYWIAIEKKYNVRSTFYIYINNGESKSFRSWLIDPSYDVKHNKKLQNQLKQMHEDCFSIGLHGSYNSALEKGVLKKEKEIVENALGIEVTKTRQHWLNYEEKSTPHFHNELFEEDSTLGWNDDIGFRSGCASRFRPYDHLNDKPFDYYIIPQVIMDSNIFDYAGGKTDEREKEGLALLQQVHKLKNAHISISWHPRTCSTDYNWHFVYERYLKYLYAS